MVSLKHLIENEVLSVTSSMRKNSRWATPPRLFSARDTTLAYSMGLRRPSRYDIAKSYDQEDIELMAGFEHLKREVREHQGIHLFQLSHKHMSYNVFNRYPKYFAPRRPRTFLSPNTLHLIDWSYYICGTFISIHLLRIWAYSAHLCCSWTCLSCLKQHCL